MYIFFCLWWKVSKYNQDKSTRHFDLFFVCRLICIQGIYNYKYICMYILNLHTHKQSILAWCIVKAKNHNRSRADSSFYVRG